MENMISSFGCSVAVLLCASSGLGVSSHDSAAAEFVGSTPGEGLVREFVGGLATNAPCHNIMWQVTLFTNQGAGAPMTYKLTARYQVPTRVNPNRSEDGPRITSQGTWEIFRDAKKADSVIYRLKAKKPQRSLSFVKVGENLLHVLNPDGTLMVGNGGWSYTLNRADRAEKPVDPSLATSAPDMSYKIAPMATGPTVFGVFEGRSPCHGIARELKLPQHAGCTKVKWRLTLYQNPETSAPTTYKIEGSLHRQKTREGTWSITHGTANDPNAVVYRLGQFRTEAALLLLKADDNILFFLNQNREPLVGHAEFSYTLNRVLSK